MEETKRCPYCGEEILAVAIKCKHCGEWLEDGNRSHPPVVAQVMPEVSAEAVPPPFDYDAEVSRWQAGADDGDGESLYHLAVAHAIQGQSTNNTVLLHAAFELHKRAAEMGVNDSWLQLAMLSKSGLGCKRSEADATRYMEYYIDGANESTNPQDLADAYSFMAWQKVAGAGTRKNVPEAYALALKAKEMGCAEADEALEQIAQHYPIGDDGEIDLDYRKRSRWLTALLVIGLLGSLLGLFFAYVKANNTPPLSNIGYFTIGMVVNLLAYGATLAWQRWGGWLLVAKLFLLSPLALVCVLMAMHDKQSLPSSSLAMFSVAFMLDPLLIVFILAMMQKRVPGYALPFCSVFGFRDDGRHLLTRAKDAVMTYGRGDAYHADSPESRIFNWVVIAATAAVLALAGYVAYSYITSHREWGMDINWKFWESPVLWPFLSFIGFFAQFFDWQHFSYKTFFEWEDSSGAKRRERNWDVLSEMEGSILVPLIMHLFFVPMTYGAVFYYVIMGVMALLGSIIPWAAAALAIAMVYLFWKFSQHLVPRRWRYPLLALWTLVMLFALAVLGVPAMDSDSNQPRYEMNADETTVGETDETAPADENADDNAIVEDESADDSVVDDNQDSDYEFGELSGGTRYLPFGDIELCLPSDFGVTINHERTEAWFSFYKMSGHVWQFRPNDVVSAGGESVELSRAWQVFHYMNLCAVRDEGIKKVYEEYHTAGRLDASASDEYYSEIAECEDGGDLDKYCLMHGHWHAGKIYGAIVTGPSKYQLQQVQEALKSSR